ncbi:phenylalanine--tRNA ligase subunit beta [Elusimicrobiota bacterium]
MKIPVDWLKEFTDLSESSDSIQQILTMRGLEVEGVTKDQKGEVIDIELTPNRGDCASVIGVARELTAYFNKTPILPDTEYNVTGDDISKSFNLDVKVPDKCPIYYLKHIKDVKISESPDWLKERLISSGIRPLNNVIDVTNYVMLEAGQPLHAFDADKISGKTVIIRSGKKGEKMETLDGKTRELTSDDIVIADKDSAIAIGGVMGGEQSSVNEGTSEILLESAFFVPESITRTERRFDLKTESSYRFTRHVDRNGVRKALERAAYLMQKVCNGKPSPGELSYNTEVETRRISLETDRINGILGTSISADQAKDYLEAIQFRVETTGTELSVEVPSFRNDVERPIDIIEEIARIHGYKNIKPTMPESKIVIDMLKNSDEFEKAEEILRSEGYWESITHTLVSSAQIGQFLKAEECRLVEIDNPININMDVMRPNLLFGLLSVCKYNLNQKHSDVKFYERGPVFSEGKKEFRESQQVAFIAQSDDFFEAKSIIVSIMDELDQDFKLDFKKAPIYFDGVRSGSILIENSVIGGLGCISPELLKIYDLKDTKIIGGYITIDALDKNRIINKKFSLWSPFPSVYRDISLVIPINLTHSDICDKIRSEGGPVLKDISLFDRYIDEKLGSEKKSFTYRLEFNLSDRTLTSEEVDEIIDKVLNKLNKSMEITLRPDK